jgi:hypothetical protein
LLLLVLWMRSFAASYKYAIITITAFIFELLLLTRFIGVFGPYISPLILFTSSLLIGIVGIQKSVQINKSLNAQEIKRDVARDEKHSITTVTSKSIGAGLLIICIGITSLLLFNLIKHHPVNVSQSDIIPQTQVLVERFLHKQFPYTIISNWGYNLFPTYLPLQWLPYIIAEYIKLDYRLFAYAILMIVVIMYFIKYKNEFTAGPHFLFCILLFLPVVLIYFFQPSIYYNSLENLIGAYYLLLAYAILTNSMVLTGVALVLCLLSRYSLVLWLPFFLFVLLLQKHRREALIVLVLGILGFLLFYFVPFLSKDTTIFMKGYQYHTTAALAEWNGQSWQQPGDKPFQLFRGLGFAGFFYDHSSGTIEQRLNSYRVLHLAFSSATVLVLCGWFYLKRKNVEWRIFSIASLKIYLAVFYSFIQIPYDYLFLVSAYCSLPIIMSSFLYSKVKVEQPANRPC